MTAPDSMILGRSWLCECLVYLPQVSHHHPFVKKSNESITVRCEKCGAWRSEGVPA